MRHNEDTRLINEALRAEETALRTLVDRLSPVIQKRVAAALWRRGGTRDTRQDVEDMVQEVFASLFSQEGKVLRAWDPARGLGLEAFVGMLAQHQVSSLLRNGRTCPWKDEPTDDDQLSRLAANPQADPEPALAAREMMSRLLGRLRAELSPRGLELFYRLLVYQEEPEAVETATGLSRDAIYQWRSRLTRLARRLASDLETPALSEKGGEMSIRQEGRAPS